MVAQRLQAVQRVPRANLWYPAAPKQLKGLDEKLDIANAPGSFLEVHFQIASGVDTPTAIEILYHWGFDKYDCIVTIVTKMDRDKPSVESVAGICSGTEWIEREMNELLGIEFKNHPDMRHLLLADDWPEGVYPLRRDFKGLGV